MEGEEEEEEKMEETEYASVLTILIFTSPLFGIGRPPLIDDDDDEHVADPAAIST